MKIQNPLLNEDSPEVLALTVGKQKVRTGGLVSIYRLSNGWIARKQEPESKWRNSTYWSIYDSMEAMEQNKALGGGDKRLSRAIVNVLNFGVH